jgi:hypothetical protein
LGEFIKRGQWFSKSSKGGYDKLGCSCNGLPLYKLSHVVTRGLHHWVLNQAKADIRIYLGNYFSALGHTWFYKKLHVLE